MATHEITPTIYIGLGGTGVMSIAHTKKMYEDEYGVGNIPPQIAFIAIDSDPMILDRTVTDMSENYIDLNNAGVDPKEYYKVRNGVYGEIQWMFPENAPDISSNMNRCLRTDGRLLTEISYHKIEAVVRMCYNKVRYNADGRFVKVYIATSLAGGTGAGSFLTVAHMLKELYRGDVHLFGYGVNYGIFGVCKPNTTHYLSTNAYASILDLDYTMHASPVNPKELSSVRGKISIQQPYFERFYVIDHNSPSNVVLNMDDLFHNIGVAMYISLYDNAHNLINWEDRQMTGFNNVENKRGWVHGLGCCQIVYKGDLLAEIYKCKAVIALIENLILCAEGIEEEALEWKKFFVDSIFPSEEIGGIPLPCLNIDDSSEVTLEKLHRYLNDVSFFPDEEAIFQKENLLFSQLDKKLQLYLDENNGVGNSTKFLETLRSICQNAIYEKQQEITLLSRELERANGIMDDGIKEYVFRRKSLIYTFSTVSYKEMVLHDSLSGRAIKLLKYKIELMRTEIAERILRKLVDYIFLVCLSRIETIRVKIESCVKSDCSERVAKFYYNFNSTSLFECNVVKSDFMNITLDEADLEYLRSEAKFMKTLDKPLYEYNREQLLEAMMLYVDSLRGVEKYRNANILDIIDSMNSTERWALEKEVAKKSEILLNFSGRGYIVFGMPLTTRMLTTTCILSFNYTDDRKKSCQSDQSIFPELFLHDAYVSYKSDNTSLKHKILVYRSCAAIIPYCLEAFAEIHAETYYKDLAIKKYNPHYDRTAFEWMQKNNFSLKPMSEMEMYPPLPCPPPKLPF